MTYKEAIDIAKQGYVCKLQKFEGYFIWDYRINELIFQNKDYKCLANSLDILNRNDFYYII